MARPTVDLDWAENDVVDPTSGQNNKVEPPTSWKNNGWSYQEKPPRNYDNYFKWNAGQWVKYLDTAIGRATTLKVAANNATAESKAHADYVCDGTDDHVEINAAITAAATTGGLVLLSEGTFTVDAAIAMATKVYLRGMGREATVIVVDTGATTDYSIIDIDSITDTGVSDLKINGSAASIARDHIGIDINGSNTVVVARVEVTSVSDNGAAGWGLLINNSSKVVVALSQFTTCDSSGIQTDNGGNRNLIVACEANSNVAAGMTLDGDNTIVEGCFVRSNTTYGIDIGGDRVQVRGCEITANADGMRTAGTRHTIVGCDIYSNTGDGIQAGGSFHRILGCDISNNDEHGIITSSLVDTLISDCLFLANSQGTHNTYDGIIFNDAASDRNTVTDCKVRQGTISPQQRYGINLTGSADNYVYGNDLVSAGATSNIVATGKTIPRWVGSAAGTNVQDDVTKANRIAT